MLGSRKVDPILPEGLRSRNTWRLICCTVIFGTACKEVLLCANHGGRTEAASRTDCRWADALGPHSWRPKWRPRTAYTGEHIRTRTNTEIAAIPHRGRLCEHRRTPTNMGEHRCGIVRNQQVTGSEHSTSGVWPASQQFGPQGARLILPVYRRTRRGQKRGHGEHTRVDARGRSWRVERRQSRTGVTLMDNGGRV